jgi:aminoglycoside phosphotransferase (APT) family kinase protein
VIATAPATAEDALRERVAEAFGTIRSWNVVGVTRRTRIVRAGRDTIVVKPLSSSSRAEALRAVMDAVHAAGVPGPRLLACLDVDCMRVVVFEYIAGTTLIGTPAHADEPWREPFAVLRQLRDVRCLYSTVDRAMAIDRQWLDRLSTLAREDDTAAAVHDALSRAAAPTYGALAHGDFAPQNLVRGIDGRAVTPIDWEEAGYARAGLDGGWLLALNRVGAGPALTRERVWDACRTAGLSTEELVWGEGLGLLRLYYRVTTWGRSDDRWAAKQAWIRAALGSYAERYPT